MSKVGARLEQPKFVDADQTSGELPVRVLIYAYDHIVFGDLTCLMIPFSAVLVRKERD